MTLGNYIYCVLRCTRMCDIRPPLVAHFLPHSSHARLVDLLSNELAFAGELLGAELLMAALTGVDD
jgi:hypothetical protein